MKLKTLVLAVRFFFEQKWEEKSEELISSVKACGVILGVVLSFFLIGLGASHVGPVMSFLHSQGLQFPSWLHNLFIQDCVIGFLLVFIVVGMAGGVLIAGCLIYALWILVRYGIPPFFGWIWENWETALERARAASVRVTVNGVDQKIRVKKGGSVVLENFPPEDSKVVIEYPHGTSVKKQVVSLKNIRKSIRRGSK